MKSSRSKFSLAERSNVLKVLGAGAAFTLPGWVLAKNSFANNSLWVPDDLPLTPQQTEGPFYPAPTIEQQLFNDTDLSRKLGDHEVAKGQRAIVEGVIKDRKGKPLANSVVEVWQACASGRYNHSRDDRNPSLLDHNFQFWGRVLTGEDGRYSFTTIVPGKYPGRTARHIHFRVDADGFKRCSTQSYFSDFGDDNLKDGIYQSLTREERQLVTVEFDKPTDKRSADKNKQAERNVEPWKGQFDLVLAKA